MLPMLLLMQAPSLEITNLKSGDVLRSSVVVVRGKAADGRVEISREGGPRMVFEAVGDTFAAPVELKPGLNTVKVSAGGKTQTRRITWKPAQSAYKVRVVYLQASDEPAPTIMELLGTTKADVIARTSTAAKLMQGFCEDHFRASGQADRTFTMDYLANGQVRVDFVTLKETGDSLRAKDGNRLWSQFYGELSKIYDFDREKILAIMGFTRYDASTQKSTGHTALGGGSLGLFGSGSMRYWPTSVEDSFRAFHDVTLVDPKVSFDDSGLRFRAWANASTTIGAMMHEMGHTFGLPHTVDNRCIMSRGFDQFGSALFGTEPRPDGRIVTRIGSYWDSVHSARLNLNPYFHADRQIDPKPIVPEINRSGDKIILSAEDGLRLISVWQDNKLSWSQSLVGESAEFSLADLRKKISGSQIHVVAVSASGGERTQRFDN